MHNIRHIFMREYVERVRTKAFLITTILTPVIFGAMIVIPMLIAMKSGAQKTRVAVAETGPNAGAICAMMQERQRRAEAADGSSPASPNERMDAKTQASARQSTTLTPVHVLPGREAEERKRLEQDVLAGRVDAFLWIEGDPLAGVRVDYAARSVTDFATINALRNLVSNAIVELRLKSRGVATAEVETLMKPVNLRTIQVTETGARETQGTTRFIISYFFTFLLYMTLILYGVSVMRSVIEEKTSRVFEVLLSTVRPFDLMAGKVLGVGAIGLTQYAIWTVLALLAGGGAGLAALRSRVGDFQVPMQLLLFMVVFFIFGYFLYSAMYAAVGAMVNTDQEAQQIQMTVLQFLIVPMLLLPIILRSPSGTASTVLSLIPFFTPILMMLRITLVMPPAWQIALSFVLMLITNVAVLWVSARIYRVGILMYGKRPTLHELVRWVRAA
jgi:ABC-2 type transport system permease protein